MNKLAVFFDIGNVMLPPKPIIRGASRFAVQKCLEYGYKVDGELYVSLYEHVDVSTKREHINHLYGDRQIATEAYKLLRSDPDIRFIGSFLTYFREYVRSKLTISTDMLSFLTRLADIGGIRVGIVSDGTTDDQLEVLTRLGIILHIDPALILVSEMVNESKNDTDIYELALERVNIPASRVFMVGDNTERDINVPQKLGIRTIWFTRYLDKAAGEFAIGADFVCQSWHQVLVVIDAAAAAARV